MLKHKNNNKQSRRTIIIIAVDCQRYVSYKKQNYCKTGIRITGTQ